MSSSSKTAFIFISEGTEEMEFTIPYDVLVRAGINVQSVLIGESSQNGWVKCSRGVKIVPDLKFDDVQDSDLLSSSVLIVPGGPASSKMSQNSRLQKLLKTAHQSQTLVAFVCAGTLSALTSGVGTGGPITSHPSVKADLEKDYKYSEERVVKSDNMITSRGPGTAFLFALTIVESLLGKEKRNEIEGPMILSSQL